MTLKKLICVKCILIFISYSQIENNFVVEGNFL